MLFYLDTTVIKSLKKQVSKLELVVLFKAEVVLLLWAPLVAFFSRPRPPNPAPFSHVGVFSVDIDDRLLLL